MGGDVADGQTMPRRVGSFEILDEVGQGGMGVVYRARDLKLDREVALKRPRPELFERPGFVERFMDEARTASSLMHPNITTVFEVLEEDGVPWLVMELIDGASLRSLLSNGQPLSCGEALRHAEGLTDALRVAHLGGVLHRDINPNNILVGKDGRARLNDFGLARAWQQPASGPEASKLTTAPDTTSGIVGTRGYMSPEQAMGKPIDPRSDLFSLGAVLYEMCTGRPAFVRRDTGEWLDALLHREPEPISRVNRDIPLEFEEIVSKALAKRPFQRYQSANEMLLDVRAVRRKLASDSGYSAPSFEQRRRRRNRWIAVAVAVGVATVGLVITSLVRRENRFPTLSQEHRRLTSGAGWAGHPAVSPDGTLIAYSSDEAGSLDLWVVRADGGEPLHLTDDPAAETAPAWFPDGSAIAFVSDRAGAPAIWRIPPLGGSAVQLLSDAAAPTISPDGTRIAFTQADAAGLSRIAVAPLDDPSRMSVLTGDGDGLWHHMEPAWSPDGRSICYAGHDDLWLVPAEGGEATRLTRAGANDRAPTWSPDGRYVFFASSPQGSLALWCVRVSDGALRRLTAGTSEEGEPSLSRDGQWLAYSVTRTNPDIEVLDRATGMRTRISGGGDEDYPAVSPDGGAVAFASDRHGSYDLWVQPLQGGRVVGPPRRLTDHQGSVSVPAFSADGRWLAYHRVVDEQRDIWMVPAAGGAPWRVTDDPANEVHPAFSPDGSMLAFVSDRDGGDHIWIAPLDKGARIGEASRLTRGDTSHLFPVWSPDGTRIAFVVEGGYANEIAVVETRGESEPRLVTDGADARRVLWAPSGDELLVAGAWGTDRVTLRLVSIVDGSTRPFEPPLDLGPADLESHIFGWDASGRILAYGVSEKKGDIWLAETDLGRRWGVPWKR